MERRWRVGQASRQSLRFASILSTRSTERPIREGNLYKRVGRSTVFCAGSMRLRLIYEITAYYAQCRRAMPIGPRRGACPLRERAPPDAPISCPQFACSFDKQGGEYGKNQASVSSRRTGRTD